MTTDAPSSHTQRLHDLRAAYADFKTVLELLKSGYRFDDADAPAALAQLEKALAHLALETRTLEMEWRQGR